MATFDSTNIQIIANSGTTINYGSMPLSPAVPDSQQLQVRWNTTTVYRSAAQGTGDPITVSEQTPEFQEKAQILDATLYSLDTDKKIILFNNGTTPIENSVFSYNGFDYYRPNVFALNITEPGVARRSTDINSSIVDFQPGARLTSELLNAANTQVLNATQEITAFSFSSGGGSGGGSDEIDLGASSIWDLGDTIQGAPGLLSFDGNDVTSGASGSLVPPSDGATEEGFVLAATDNNNVSTWYDLPAALQSIQDEIFDLSLGQVLTNAQGISALDAKTVNILPPPDTNAINGTAFTGDISAVKYVLDNGDATPPNLTFDNTTNGTYNNVQLNIPGTDTGGGSYVTRNQDGSVIRNTNASGYEWFYQAGNDFTDPSTWRQDGAILIDPRAKDSSNNNYARVLVTQDTGSSYQLHSLIAGRTNRSMWRTSDKDYTYVIAPGDESGSVFQAVKDIGGQAKSIAHIDDDGNAYFRGNLTVDGTVTEGSDATIKDYVPGQDPSGSVIDKVQSLSTLGAWEYKDNPGVYHYGPTTQDLAAVGLDIAKGVDNQLSAGPTEEATDETTASNGTAATTATQTLETLSMTGLLTKAAAELKDLSDDSFTAIEALDDYLINDLTPFLTNLNDRIAALENGTPGPAPGTMPDPPVLDLPGLGAG